MDLRREGACRPSSVWGRFLEGSLVPKRGGVQVESAAVASRKWTGLSRGLSSIVGGVWVQSGPGRAVSSEVRVRFPFGTRVAGGGPVHRGGGVGGTRLRRGRNRRG